MRAKLDKRHLDISRIFITFVTLCGDVQRTAAALDINPEIIQQLAEEEGWLEKISRISLLSKSGKPGEFEKATNRAICFVQAHRLRQLLDTMIARFNGMTPEEVCDALSSSASNGNTTVSARFFSDLASAMEKTHHASYLALGDSLAERPDPETEEGTLSANQMHAAVLQALNNPAVKGIETKLLQEEQQALAPICPTQDERKKVEPKVEQA